MAATFNDFMDSLIDKAGFYSDFFDVRIYDNAVIIGFNDSIKCRPSAFHEPVITKETADSGTHVVEVQQQSLTAFLRDIHRVLLSHTDILKDRSDHGTPVAIDSHLADMLKFKPQAYLYLNEMSKI